MKTDFPFGNIVKNHHFLNGSFQHNFFNLTDGTGRIQVFRTYVHAVHDGMAAEQTIRVVQIVQTLIGNGIAAVGNEAVGVQQTGRTDEFVGIPPERRTDSRTTGAQNTSAKIGRASCRERV